MSEFVLPEAEDGHDIKLLADVKEVGWHIIGIEAEGEEPVHSFSVGLTYTLNKPEILIMGLPHDVSVGIINNIGELLKEGITFKVNQNYEDILEGVPVQFIDVDKSHYHEYLGYARWFYSGNKFKALQMIWPDKQGNFPWEKCFDERYKSFQKLLNQQIKK